MDQEGGLLAGRDTDPTPPAFEQIGAPTDIRPTRLPFLDYPALLNLASGRFLFVEPACVSGERWRYARLPRCVRKPSIRCTLASHLPTNSIRKSIDSPHDAIQCGDHEAIDMRPHMPGEINMLLICLLIRLLTVLVMVGINARFSVRINAQISAW